MDLVIREKNLLNWNQKTLTRFGWANVYPDFKELTGLNYDEKQLQNKLSHLRRHYYRWLKLQNQSGLGVTRPLVALQLTPRFGRKADR